MLTFQTDTEGIHSSVSASVAFYPNCVWVVEETLGASALGVFLFIRVVGFLDTCILISAIAYNCMQLHIFICTLANLFFSCGARTSWGAVFLTKNNKKILCLLLIRLFFTLYLSIAKFKTVFQNFFLRLQPSHTRLPRPK